MEQGIYKSEDCSGDKLILIDKPGQFSLKIGGKEIPYVTGYSITRNTEECGYVELTLKICIPREEIGIKSDCDLR